MRIVIGEGSCGVAAGAAKVHKAIESLMGENERLSLEAPAVSECAFLSQSLIFMTAISF